MTKTKTGIAPLSWIDDTRKKKTPAKSTQRTQRVQSTPETRPASENGCKPGYTRRTFHVKKDHLEKLQAVAYWERIDIKDVLEDALTTYLRGKRVKPIPKR